MPLGAQGNQHRNRISIRKPFLKTFADTVHFRCRPSLTWLIYCEQRAMAFAVKKFVLALLILAAASDAFSRQHGFSHHRQTGGSITTNMAVQSATGQSAGYVPKWKKKNTLAEEYGSIDDFGFEKVGLKGSIPVVFKQGNATRTSMAWTGQPIKDVACV